MNISRNKGTFIYEKYTNKDGSRNQNLYHRLDQFLMNPSTVNRHNFYTMTVSEEEFLLQIIMSLLVLIYMKYVLVLI